MARATPCRLALVRAASTSPFLLPSSRPTAASINSAPLPPSARFLLSHALLRPSSAHGVLLGRAWASSSPSPPPPFDPSLAARLRLLLRRRPRLLIIDRRRPSLTQLLAFLALFILASTASYNLIPATRHFAQAIVRCTRLMAAVAGDVVEYKRTFGQEYASEDEKLAAYSACHLSSATRLLRALEKLGGIYIKVRCRQRESARAAGLRPD